MWRCDCRLRIHPIAATDLLVRHHSGQAQRAKRSRWITVFGRFAKSCSQTRTTFHPACRSSRLIRRSRDRFRASLADQKSLFELTFRLHFGHPCQKHPSTNTSTRSIRNVKSGRPCRGCFLRQPVIPCCRIIDASRSPVLAFPEDLIAAMTSDRFAGE